MTADVTGNTQQRRLGARTPPSASYKVDLVLNDFQLADDGVRAPESGAWQLAPGANRAR